MNFNDFILMNLTLAIFYVIYQLFLNGQTHFRWSRAFLMSGIAVVAFLPFLPVQGISAGLVSESFVLPEINIPETTGSSSSISWWQLCVFTYFVIAAGFAFRAILSIYQTHRKVSRARRLPHLGKGIWESPTEYSFSFLGKIYLQKNLDWKEQQTILAHEQTHQREKHALDLLIAEVVKAAFWINPVAWLYKKRLAELHEFTADASVTEISKEIIHYQELLIANALGISRKELIHPFINQSILKRRIMMINKNSSSSWSKFRYALFIPALGGMLALASCQKNTESEDLSKSEVVQRSEGVPENFTQPEFPGGNEKMFEFITMNINYPENAKNRETEGTVFAGFTVQPDGSISDIKILRGVSAELDEETIKLIHEMPNWEPGLKDDKPVATEMTLPVKFQLPKEDQ